MPVDRLDLAHLPDPYPVPVADGPLDATVSVPGSKSVTNRALVCAALADGPSTLTGALFADDTEAMLGVLRTLGVEIDAAPAGGTISVTGGSGQVPAGGSSPAGALALDLRQSGTTARFVIPMLALGDGHYDVGGHAQLRARPMDDSLHVLAHLGFAVDEQGTDGRLPARVHRLRATAAHTTVEVAGDRSSQFLSGVLLAAPCLPGGLRIQLTTPLVSRPYVDLTISVMEAFGAEVGRPDDRTFVVAPTGYRATVYAVEPDASAASYPLAAAAICGGRVRVRGLGRDALQGDARFAEVLGAMGATVTRDHDGTEVVVDGPLRGGDFDFTDISDTAQSLAVVAPFAAEPVRVTGIGFIRRKETDRITAVATELRRCGVRVDDDPDGWTIHPGALTAAVVETYDDHRMAMSFALLGLRVPGIEIAGPACVAKTFPGYWALLDALGASASDGR